MDSLALSLKPDYAYIIDCVNKVTVEKFRTYRRLIFDVAFTHLPQLRDSSLL
jgi:hypothetical protein